MTSFFPICSPFISFFCLLLWVVFSELYWKRSRDSRQFCLIPDFNGIALRFSSYNSIGCGLSYIAFIMLMDALSGPIPSKILIMEACWILSKVFLTSVFFFLSLSSFIIIYCVCWPLYVEPSLHFWINPTWSWCLIFLICACLWFASILLGCVHQEYPWVVFILLLLCPCVVVIVVVEWYGLCRSLGFFFFLFLNSLRRISCRSFLKVW